MLSEIFLRSNDNLLTRVFHNRAGTVSDFINKSGTQTYF
jgi:hypothetical protein